MSLWNIQVVAPLMMHAVEMYMITAVTLMTTVLGFKQSCLQYCTSSPENSYIPPECNCSLHTLHKTRSTTTKHIATLPEIKDSGIYYDPMKQNDSQNTSFDEQTLHMLSLNPIFKTNQNIFKSSKKEVITANTGESFTEQDSYDKNDSKSSNKFKRSDTYFPKLVDETKELPLNLYLDIDIAPENDNRPQLAELTNMFENFQTAEKTLSECINLHIYIFSKYTDTSNKTNTNWGRKGQHDNLSSLQQLTEIQSKCDQPASIIKQSIYQIKQFMSREDTTTEITQDEQETIETADSYKEIGAQNPANEFGNLNVTSDNMYPNALTSHHTDNSYIVRTEAADFIDGKINDVQFDKNYSEFDDRNLFNNDLPGIKNNDFTSSTSSFHEDSTVSNKINLKAATDSIDYGNLRTTSESDRTVLSEEEVLIPRIITKELANGTLLSGVDGYEKNPNSDFVTNSIMSTPANIEPNTKTDFLKSNIDKIAKSDIVHIHGNLYFSFGEKQIPARFIQQSDGELDVAIDGFSMCGQMLEYNTSGFMNSLCKCIIHKNCT